MANELDVYLIDDHAILRQGLASLINSQQDMKVIGQAGDGQEALQCASAAPNSVFVVDISMPRMNGIEITERLKRLLPQARVIVLSRHCDVGYLRMILQAGAAGYVSKHSSGDDLLTAIRTVAAGGTFIDQELAGKLVNNYLGRQAAKTSPQFAELSEREESVLKALAWGYSNKEIADQLKLSIKTVEYHKGRAMEKLALRSRADIVNYALHKGWLQES